jgi:hypothetical protein
MSHSDSSIQNIPHQLLKKAEKWYKMREQESEERRGETI